MVLLGALALSLMVFGACTSADDNGSGPAASRTIPSVAPSGISGSTATGAAGEDSLAFVQRLRAWVAECRPSCSTPRVAAVADAPVELRAFCRTHAPVQYAKLPLYVHVGYHDRWPLSRLMPMTYTDDVTCRWAATLASEPSAELDLLVPSAGPEPQRFACGARFFPRCVVMPGGQEFQQPLAAGPATGAYGETMTTATWFVGTTDLLVVVGVTALTHARVSAMAVTRATMSRLLTNLRLAVPGG